MGGHVDHPELDGEDLELEDVLAGDLDMTPVLTRRFVWDTTACRRVPDLLTALGLTHGSDEGMELDHSESHHRMHHVLPLEGQLQVYSQIIGTILTKAILSRSGVEISEEDELGFAAQNAETVVSGARAIISQLIYTGVLQPGPLFDQMHILMTEADGE